MYQPWKEYTSVSQKLRICLIIDCLKKFGTQDAKDKKNNKRRWFKKWEVKELFELLGNAMKYVIIEDRLLETQRMNWQGAKMSKLRILRCNY